MPLTGVKSKYILFAAVEYPLIAEPKKRTLSLWQATMTADDKNTNNIVGIEYRFMWIISKLFIIEIKVSILL